MTDAMSLRKKKERKKEIKPKKAGPQQTILQFPAPS
jgi:hypothetical protein